MLWKRLAPIALAAAVIATVVTAASTHGPLADCCPRSPDTFALRAL